MGTWGGGVRSPAEPLGAVTADESSTFPPSQVLGGQVGAEQPIAMPWSGGICWGQRLALKTPSCAHPAWMNLMGLGFYAVGSM